MTERSKFLDRFPATPPPPLPPPNAPAGAPVQQQSTTDQYFTRVEARPPTFTPAPPAKRPKALPIAIVTVLVLGGAVTMYLTHRGAKPLPPPRILPPSATATAIPTSLNDVTREEAESYRHTALQAVEQAGSSDPDELHQIQPTFKWVSAPAASANQTIVSVGQDQNGITIAITAANKQVCAFGRWSPSSAPTYVDVEYQRVCAADQAPDTGWSTQAGGSNTDLPDDTGS
jgi:hypothetical protein